MMKNGDRLQPYVSRRTGPLMGTPQLPGDRRLSQRALLLGSVAVGATSIRGLSENADVLAMIDVLRAAGATINNDGGVWFVEGAGRGGLSEPSSLLNCGGGSGAALLLGLFAAQPFTSFLTVAPWALSRPWDDVMTPLEQMGAFFVSRSGARMPLAVNGASCSMPIVFRTRSFSDEAKTAVLLAGLNVAGLTTIIERWPSYDDTERLLRHFGASLSFEPTVDGAESLSLQGQTILMGQNLVMPSDAALAAYPLVGALLRPGSALTLRDINAAPRRMGLVAALQAMGANIVYSNAREQCGLSVADLMVQNGLLRGVDFSEKQLALLADEIPLLLIAAACAHGSSRFSNLLRDPASECFGEVIVGLQACGTQIEIEGASLIIDGNGQPPRGGAFIRTTDPVVAMAFLTLGMATIDPITIEDAGAHKNDAPEFVDLMNKLGARIEVSGKTAMP